MAARLKKSFIFYTCLILKLRVYSQGNFVFDSTNVQINALNINTKESEFGPFRIDKKFYYTSSRERRLGVINLDAKSNHQMLDIYEADVKDSVTLQNNHPLRNTVNNSYHQGSSFFDKNSNKLYYAGNIRADYRGEKYKLAIFSTELKEGRFERPKVELLLPDTFLASHPMVYNNKLYFSSNLKGGKGKADLYVAQQVNGRWGNITNLKELNSEEDDYFPFVINEREIYFSSNRRGGFGRLDLYKYTLTDDNKVQIVNLGKPINSSYDDYSAWVDGSQESGYFTTTRNGEQDDIYYFAKTWPTFNNCVEAIKETYCYDITDEKSLETDSLKGYFYEWDFGDGTRQKGVSVTHCYAQPGTYVVNLNIIDVSTKAVFLNQTAIDLYVDSLVQLKINTLDTILVNKPITINTLGTYLPGKKITGYYFELDNKRFRQSSLEYAFSKTGLYRIKLGVEYHDTELNKTGTMCTTLDVHIVDSTAWLPFEKRKIDDVVNRFDLKNIQAKAAGLGEMDYDAELSLNGKLGLSREKLAERIDQFLGTQTKSTELPFDYARPTAPTARNLGIDRNRLNGLNDDLNLELNTAPKSFFGKNINGERNLLTELNEDAELTYRVHLGSSRTKMDTTVLNAKGLHGISEELIDGYYVYTFGNEAKPSAIDTYYKKALSAGLADVDVFAYRNNVIDKQDFIAAQQQKQGFFGRNINGTRQLLSELSEEADLTYRVHLGKSKVPMDTAVLNARGLYGIREEKVEGYYVYTYGNAAKPSDIDVYYKKALSAGLADVEVFGYKNNQLRMDEYKAAQSGLFGKTIHADVQTLNGLEENAELTYRVHLGKSKTPLDASIFTAKGLSGVKEEKINGYYVYTYGNASRAKDVEQLYKKALTAGFAEVEVYGYRNNQLLKEQYAAAQSGFFGKRINAERSNLSDLSEEAELTYRVHLGRSTSKMDTAVLHAKGIYGVREELIEGQYVYTYGNASRPKDIERYYKKALAAGLAEVDVFAYRNNTIEKLDYLSAQVDDRPFFAKNISASKNTLSGLEEDMDVTFRVMLGRSKTRMDTTILRAKGLTGIREEKIGGDYVYTYGNSARIGDIGKYYQRALDAGVSRPEVFAYHKNKLNEAPYIASLERDLQEQLGQGHYANIAALKDTLLHLSEDAELTFRVFLGKSKTRKNLAKLEALGLKGIKEELIDDSYVYTYASEKKISKIEKYYKDAQKAGVKYPVILAYRNNELVANQRQSLRTIDFDNLPELELLANEQPRKEGFFKRRRREREKAELDSQLVAAAEKSPEPGEKPAIEAKRGMPDAAELDRSEDKSVQPAPAVAEGPKKQSGSKTPFERPPVGDPPEGFGVPDALKPDDVKIKDVGLKEEEVSEKRVMEEFVAKYGNSSAKDLEFRVQISAFKYRNRYEFPHLAGLGKIENTLTDGGITRITIGGVFDTYKKALELNKKVVAAGQADAFVTVFYKGKRVYPENLEKMGIFLTK